MVRAVQATLCLATWPWRASESGLGRFTLPLSSLCLLFLHVSAQALSSRETCPDFPDKVQCPYSHSTHTRHLSFGVTVTTLLYCSASSVEQKPQAPRSTSVSAFHPTPITLHGVWRMAGIQYLTNLLLTVRFVCVPTLREVLSLRKDCRFDNYDVHCNPRLPKHRHNKHTHYKLTRTDLSPVAEYGS